MFLLLETFPFFTPNSNCSPSSLTLETEKSPLGIIRVYLLSLRILWSFSHKDDWKEKENFSAASPTTGGSRSAGTFFCPKSIEWPYNRFSFKSPSAFDLPWIIEKRGKQFDGKKVWSNIGWREQNCPVCDPSSRENILVRFNFFCDVGTSNIESFRWICLPNVDSFVGEDFSSITDGNGFWMKRLPLTAVKAEPVSAPLFWMQKLFALSSCQNVLMPNWTIGGEMTLFEWFVLFDSFSTFKRERACDVTVAPTLTQNQFTKNDETKLRFPELFFYFLLFNFSLIIK